MPDGEITCTKFIDANGKKYNDWISAIRLWWCSNQDTARGMKDEEMGACMGPACNSFAFSFANSNDLPLPGEHTEDGYRTTIHPVFPRREVWM